MTTINRVVIAPRVLLHRFGSTHFHPALTPFLTRITLELYSSLPREDLKERWKIFYSNASADMLLHSKGSSVSIRQFVGQSFLGFSRTIVVGRDRSSVTRHIAYIHIDLFPCQTGHVLRRSEYQNNSWCLSCNMIRVSIAHPAEPSEATLPHDGPDTEHYRQLFFVNMY